jgi:hypothetical protein
MESENKTPEELALEESLQKAKVNSHANHHTKIDLAELNARLK